MASIYFRGRIDFEALSMSEISEITAAIATLEAMSQKHGFEFSSGPSRRGVPRPDVAGPRSSERPKAQRRLLLALVSRNEPLTLRDIAAVTGLKEGTINPHLSALFNSGIIHRSKVPNDEATERPGPKSITLYSLTDHGREVATEIKSHGERLID